MTSARPPRWRTRRPAPGDCPICGTSLTLGRGGHARDHEHISGQSIRGLLCPACNVGLGHFKDSPALLRRAAKYLEAAHRRLGIAVCDECGAPADAVHFVPPHWFKRDNSSDNDEVQLLAGCERHNYGASYWVPLYGDRGLLSRVEEFDHWTSHLNGKRPYGNRPLGELLLGWLAQHGVRGPSTPD
jgi:hypothetical protein